MVMLLNPHRKRRRRRNSWKGQRTRHRRAACKVWRRRKGKGYRCRRRCKRGRKCGRRGRKGRGSSPPAEYMSFFKGTASEAPASPSTPYFGSKNGRRRRRKHRNGMGEGSRWIPSFGMNPGRLVSNATAAFKPAVLGSTLPVIGGFLGAKIVGNLLASYIPVSMLKTEPGSYVPSLIGGGIAASLVGMINRKYVGPMILGSAIFVMTKAMYKYILPRLGFTPLLQGMDDYLTVGDASRATPLGYLGDYLTVGDASRATPLGYVGDMSEGDEIESM